MRAIFAVPKTISYKTLKSNHEKVNLDVLQENQSPLNTNLHRQDTNSSDAVKLLKTKIPVEEGKKVEVKNKRIERSSLGFKRCDQSVKVNQRKSKEN